jgi:transcriptional regulator with XRE-family HTH domain
MPDRSRRRTGSDRRRGQGRAGTLAARLGLTVKTARRAQRMTQTQLGGRAGISQTAVSKLERARGATFSLETWASIGAALGQELNCYLRGASGADLPRAPEHLRRQQLVLGMARSGAWEGRIEEPVQTADGRTLSIDVLLLRAQRREIVVTEVWDWLGDVGDAFRSHAAKMAAVASRYPDWVLAGLFVVRGTRRNHELVRELHDVFTARFPVSAGTLLRALSEADRPLPAGSVLAWTDAGATRLLPSRLS